MNKKNWLKIIEIVLIIIVIFSVTWFKFVKEYKENLGSSERFFNYNKYQTSLRVKNNNIDIILLINKNQEISNLIMLSDESFILYNQFIEDTSINNGIVKILTIFKNNNYLTSDIKLINYKDIKISNKIKKEIEKYLTENSININVLEENSTLDELKFEYNIEENNEKEILENLYFNSMEKVIESYKEEKPHEEQSNNINYKDYADNVYKKLTNYKIKNNIKNQNIKDNTIKIELIPADENSIVYPESDSWYYIKNSSVFAYIKFKINDKIIDFCYNGSIDNYKEGVCNEK